MSAKDWRELITPPTTEENFAEALRHIENRFELSSEAVFEIYKRQGVENFMEHLVNHTDEELNDLFESYTSASMAEQHYLSEWFYEFVNQVIPDMVYGHRDLLYRETLRWAERRQIINEGEFIRQLHEVATFKDDISEFLNGLTYVPKLREYYKILTDKTDKLKTLRPSGGWPII